MYIITMYTENPKGSTKTLLYLLSAINKTVGFKVIWQKSNLCMQAKKVWNEILKNQ
jgi:hypothetical protein